MFFHAFVLFYIIAVQVTCHSQSGVHLVVLLFFTQFLRNVTFNMQQSIGIHTGGIYEANGGKIGKNVGDLDCLMLAHASLPSTSM